MPKQSSDDRFGCERCWPASADTAHEARYSLARVADLVNESHFHVMILACPSCAQRFVSVFTETIDWADGEDPQSWAVLPLTADEASDLARQGSSLTEAALNALGTGRKCLRHDRPRGAKARSFWATGMLVFPHD